MVTKDASIEYLVVRINFLEVADRDLENNHLLVLIVDG
jgi:hypothetical protein